MNFKMNILQTPVVLGDLEDVVSSLVCDKILAKLFRIHMMLNKFEQQFEFVGIICSRNRSHRLIVEISPNQIENILRCRNNLQMSTLKSYLPSLLARVGLHLRPRPRPLQSRRPLSTTDAISDGNGDSSDSEGNPKRPREYSASSEAKIDGMLEAAINEQVILTLHN